MDKGYRPNFEEYSDDQVKHMLSFQQSDFTEEARALLIREGAARGITKENISYIRNAALNYVDRNARCSRCRADLTLDDSDIIAGEFDCPTCGSSELVVFKLLAGNARNAPGTSKAETHTPDVMRITSRDAARQSYTYDILQDPSGVVELVKRGWSWPGFFFVGLWGIVCRLWVQVLSLLLAELVFISSMAILFKDSSVAGWGYVLLLRLGAPIFFGMYGNEWRIHRLLSEGFTCIAVVDANSKTDAVSRWRAALNQSKANSELPCEDVDQAVKSQQLRQSMLTKDNTADVDASPKQNDSVNYGQQATDGSTRAIDCRVPEPSRKISAGWFRLAVVVSPFAGLLTASLLESTGSVSDRHLTIVNLSNGYYIGLAKTNLAEFVFGAVIAFAAIVFLPRVWRWISQGFSED